MRLARWWTRTVLSRFAEIVSTLLGPVGEPPVLADTLRKAVDCGGRIPHRPVIPVSNGRIRIIHQYCEALRGGRWFGPGKLRRNVGSLTTELLGNAAAVREG